MLINLPFSSEYGCKQELYNETKFEVDTLFTQRVMLIQLEKLKDHNCNEVIFKIKFNYVLNGQHILKLQ